MNATFCRHTLARLLLAAALIPAVVATSDAGNPFDPLKIGAYRATHMSVYNKYTFNRDSMGTPLENETDVVATATGIRGSRMVFTNAIIYRMENGGYPGRTTIVRAGIRRLYEQNGGIYGPLGFPVEARFTISPGRFGQQFERGMIVWNPNTAKYVVVMDP